MQPGQEPVAVIGLGTMGRSIARLLVAGGIEVRGFDPAGVAEPLEGVVLARDLEECASGSAVVIEAIPERFDLKVRVLGEISRATTGIIASNTSTFVPSTLAPHVEAPERFLVGHFFNPADLIPLVEVVPHSGTAPDAVERFVALMRRLDRRPVVVRAERAGFVANRLQAAVLREALALVADGVVTASDLDEIVRSGLAARWAAVGPIGVADLGGLDVFEAVCRQILPTLDASVDASPLLVERVERGDLGAKSGTGFYTHDSGSLAATRATVARVLVAQHGGGADPAPVGASGAASR